MSTVAEPELQHSAPPRTASTVRVALAGCGAVGSALLRELAARRETLAARHGLDVVVTRVLVRDPSLERRASFDRSLLTADVHEFLATDTDVVIEAIGGLEPARQIAVSTLSRGRELVSANKELLAACGTELAALAASSGTSLRYDAAVGGGVPVLRLLDDALGAGTPSRVRGILNGTSNFVLSRLQAGATQENALAAARKAGFAESDASRDLDGRDAAAKLALVAWAAFGVAPESVRVARTSLLPDPARYVRLGARFERTVRQVAECAVVPDGLASWVAPVLLDPRSALAQTFDEENRVEVHSGWSAPLCASGPGAGGVPTATALLSDLVARHTRPARASRSAPSVADTRPTSWAIEVRGAPALLHRLLPSCGCVETDALAEYAWTVVQATISEEMRAVVEVLSARGADPIAARIDSGATPRAEAWS